MEVSELRFVKCDDLCIIVVVWGTFTHTIAHFHNIFAQFYTVIDNTRVRQRIVNLAKDRMDFWLSLFKLMVKMIETDQIFANSSSKMCVIHKWKLVWNDVLEWMRAGSVGGLQFDSWATTWCSQALIGPNDVSKMPYGTLPRKWDGHSWYFNLVCFSIHDLFAPNS